MAEPGGGGVRMNRIGGWEVWLEQSCRLKLAMA
jgi:hypothetical protein